MPLETSLLLTIAIKHFDAPGVVKGVIAAAGGVGMLASPFVVAATRYSRHPAMQIVAWLSIMSTAAFAAAAAGSLTIFVVGSLLAIAGLNAMIPLVTVTYERNFPPGELGRRVGWGMSIKVLVSVVVGLAMGELLDRRPDLWWVAVVCGALAFAAMIPIHHRVPSDALDHTHGERSPVWPHFHLLLEDRKLMLTLSAWMLMGFGNLMLLPLRVEYLATPEYGINASESKIAMLTVVVPSVVRLLMMPVFGHVFDRMSFFSSRILVNIFFALYVAAFFTGTSDAGLVLGAMLLGVGAAGGDLMWSLWVTKFAPPGRTADYMGLHTFFTGIRAVVAPILGFLILGRVSLTSIALLAATLMVGASLVLVPEARAERNAKLAAAT